MQGVDDRDCREPDDEQFIDWICRLAFPIGIAFAAIAAFCAFRFG